MYYHRGKAAPRCAREVDPRPLTEDEQGHRDAGRPEPKGSRPAYPNAYTPESVDSYGRFIYAVPDEPVMKCVVALPAMVLYPSDAANELLTLGEQRTLYDETRMKVSVEPCKSFASMSTK
jgi:hypothetical protein